MRKFFFFLILMICCLAGCSTTRVKYQKTLPPELDVQDIDRLAVVDFEGLDQAGRLIASKLASGIVDNGYYRLFERSRLDDILEEHDLYKQGISIDPTTVHKLKLNGVDAVIFGMVDVYDVEDLRGFTWIEKKVRTGEFHEVSYEDPKTGETHYREEEIMRTEMWRRPYVIREGTVGVTFRMASIVTGEIVAVEAMTSSFSEKSWYDEMAQNLPSKDQVLDNLAGEVVYRFLQKIHPRAVYVPVDLEKTEGRFNEIGIDYARHGLWDKAFEAFERDLSEDRGDPARLYNLAMAHYIMGRPDQAETLIEKAIALNPEHRYMQALVHIRKDLP